MKKERSSRFVSGLALLLSVLMLLTLVACDKKTDDEDTEKKNKKPRKSSVSVTETTDPVDEEDVDGKDPDGDEEQTVTTGTINSALDLSELYAQIGVAEYLTESDYTADSWADLESTLQKAKEACYADTQADVDRAVSELQAAIDGLVEASTTDSDTDGDTEDTEASSDGSTTTKKDQPTSTTKQPSVTTTTKKPSSATTTKKPTATSRTTTTTKPASQTLLDQVPSELSGTKIKMMIWWYQSTDDTQRVTTFKNETGIQVSYETATLDKYISNLSAKIMSGNPPAIAAIINEWYPQPITRGLMQPIENTGWNYSDSIYNTQLMDQFSYKGEWYGIALKGSNAPTYEVMFFNKKVLKANGVSQDPYQLWKSGKWNWDTCLEIAQKCTNSKKSQYGLTNISQFYWMLSAGQDFVLSDNNGLKNNIKSSKLANAWTHAWDMIYTHKVIPTTFSNQQQLFYNGSVAMLGAGSYMMGAEGSNYVPRNMTDEWGVVPFPSPKGQTAVAACEGAVWGFPTKVKGNQLKAAMWYLRYYLDDANYAARDFYPTEECWEVMTWMSNQKTQSYNSVGVVSYGGKYHAWSIQYDLIDEATTKAQVKSNLDSWYDEIQANIDLIQSEMS